MKKKRFAAAIASLAVVASMVTALPMGASAAGTSYTAGLTSATDSDNKAVSTNTTSFDKYLVMNVNANVPNTSFNFSIAKYDNTADEKAVIVSADTDTLAVLNGVGTPAFKSNDSANTGSNTAGQVTFTTTDTTVTESEAGASTSVVWQDTTSGNEKYASKKLTIDFSSVQFTEPGVYRYLITEADNTAASISNDTGVTGENNTYRTLDVYVQDYADYYDNLADKTGYTEPNGKELFIADYVLYAGKFTSAPKAAGGNDNQNSKSDSYTNAYTTHDLTFSKTVAGNQGSKDKYFAFTLTISNAVAGTVYDVDLTNATAEFTSSPNAATTISALVNADSSDNKVTQPTTLTANTSGTITQVYYLQHGQSITVKGLAEGTSYTITEAPEDYSDTATVSGDTKTDDKTNTAETGEDPVYGSAISYSNHAIADTYISDDANVAFTNTRQGVIPTGILLSVAAPIIFCAVMFGGIALLIAKKLKKRTQED